MRALATARLVGRVFAAMVLRRARPLLATVIVTDRCNLHCTQCTVQAPGAPFEAYPALVGELRALRSEGVAGVIFSGGEPLLWRDGARTVRDLLAAASELDLVTAVVTNGTLSADLPEADLVLVSVDGDRATHDALRGVSHERVIANVDAARTRNICLYMAVNARNEPEIRAVARLAREHANVRGISFNFHVPYPGTEALALTAAQKRDAVRTIGALIDEGYPVLNLKATLRAYLDGDWPRPCRHCVLTDAKRRFVCGRCIDVPGLCDECGYLFATELGILLARRPRAIAEALWRYPAFIAPALRGTGSPGKRPRAAR